MIVIFFNCSTDELCCLFHLKICPWCFPVTAAENAEKERSIMDPAYVPLAPCPCDMTENLCDMNCCCDTVRMTIVTFS